MNALFEVRALVFSWAHVCGSMLGVFGGLGSIELESLGFLRMLQKQFKASNERAPQSFTHVRMKSDPQVQ